MARGVPVSIRLGIPWVEWVDDIRVEPGLEEADRTAVIKAALVVAKRHTPELIETVREQL